MNQRSGRPRGQTGYSESQNHRPGNRGQSDYNEDHQNYRQGNRGQSGYTEGQNYRPVNRRQRDNSEGQNYRLGNRGQRDYNEGQNYGQGNRGQRDYNEGQNYGQGNRGQSVFNESQNYGQGNRGQRDFSEGQNYGQVNRGQKDYNGQNCGQGNKGQSVFNDSQNYGQGNRGQRDFNEGQNYGQGNRGQRDFNDSQNYGQGNRGQRDYTEGQNYGQGNRGQRDYNEGQNYGQGNRGQRDLNEGQNYGQGNRGQRDYNEGQNYGQGNRGQRDLNEGQNYGQGNRGQRDYNEGKNYGQGNRGQRDYNEGQNYGQGNRAERDYNEGQNFCNKGQRQRSENRGGSRGRGGQRGSGKTGRSNENLSRQEQFHGDNLQEYNDEGYIGNIRNAGNRGGQNDHNEGRGGQRGKGARQPQRRTPNRGRGNEDNHRQDKFQNDYKQENVGLLQTPTVHPIPQNQQPIGPVYVPQPAQFVTVPPPYPIMSQPPPPLQPPIMYPPPLLTGSNLLPRNHMYGSSMTLNDPSNKRQSNRQDNQQNRHFNETNQRKGNLPRSTSTPAVNMIGARPKIFTEKIDNKKGQSEEKQTRQKNSKDDNRHQIAPDREDRYGDSVIPETGHGTDFRNRRGSRNTGVPQNSSECLTDDERNKQDGKLSRGGGGRSQFSRNGRGRGRGKLYDKSRHRRTDNQNVDKKSNPQVKYDTYDGRRKPKVNGKELRGFPRGLRFRGRGRPSTRYRGFIEQNEDEDDDTNSSVFGSSLSLTSEVSDVVGDAEDRNKLNVDDLDVTSTSTLRNREKRYKKRLGELKKNENMDTNKVQAFEKALALIREAINRRPKTSEPQEDGEAVESGQEQTLKDIDKPTVNIDNTTKNTKDPRIGKQTKKPILIASKRIVFKPVNKNRKQHGKAPQKHKITEMVSTSSSEETVTSDTDGKDSDELDKEKDEKVKTEKAKKRRGRKKKINQHKNVVDQNKNEKKQLSDALDRLDEIGIYENKPKNTTNKSNLAPAGESKENQSRKPRFSFQYEDCDSRDTIKISETVNNSVKKGKANKTNDKTQNAENGPDVNEVFKFLVKHLNAEATPSDIIRESGLFPSGCDTEKWFRAHRNRFALLERNGRVVKVMAFNKDMTYCLDYITRRLCKPECDRYHVCKDLLCGYCHYGKDQCQFSHDFLDEEKNLTISKKFGYYNIFTNDEICCLLSVRYPHICMQWNENGACEDHNCTRLHICQRFFLGRCLEDEAKCPLSHDKFSNHNKPIIDAYRMSKMNESAFRRLIFIQRSVRPRTESADNSTDSTPERDKVEGVPVEAGTISDQAHKMKPKPRKPSGAGREERKKRDDISSLPDNLQNIYICELNLSPAGCKTSKCRSLHFCEKVPYIWQLKAFGKWISFYQSEVIEQAYCNRQDGATTDLEMDSNMYSVEVRFEPKLHAFLNMMGLTDGQEVVEVRRISTCSYMEKAYTPQSYKTQWRWYFRNDIREWELFEQNMQYTLEKKFLAQQKEYLYSRENFKFKYEFSFEAMNQKNLDTGKIRSALRRPLFISRDDIDSGKFPDSLKAPPVVPTPLPPKWSPWDLCNPFEFVRLSSESTAYKDVESSFFKTMDNERFRIMDIFRVQNPQMWSAYCNEEKSMQATLERSGKEDAVVDKKNLFHGTDSLNAVRGIAINNFDFRLSGKNATRYGNGAYFAKDAKYSHSYTDIKDSSGERYMFRATVLVGEYTKGHPDHKRPPQKHSRDHELYDSCVDNEDFPKIFILYERAKYYPEYLITYQEENDPFQINEFTYVQPPQPQPRPVPRPRAVATTPTTFVSQTPSSISTTPISPTSYPSPSVDSSRTGSASSSAVEGNSFFDLESIQRQRYPDGKKDKKTECCIQ